MKARNPNRSQAIRRYWLPGGVVLSLVVVIFTIWRSQQIPPPEAETLRVFHDHYQTVTAEKFGPVLPGRYYELRQQLGRRPPSGVGSQPSRLVTQEFESWIPGKLEVLRDLGEFNTAGITLPTFEQGGRDIHYPGLEGVVGQAHSHRLIALRHMHDEDWEGALRALESAAHAGTPVRLHGWGGHWYHHYSRSIAYRGYLSLLAFDLPEAILEQALSTLIELETTDPAFDEWLQLSFRGYNAGWLLSFEPDGGGRLEIPAEDRSPALMLAATRAVRMREHIESPVLKARAEKYRDLVAYHHHGVILYTGELLDVYGLAWTRVPAMVRFVKRTAEREPALFDPAAVPDELRDSLDPWTVAVYLEGFQDQEPLSWGVPSRVATTLAALTREAFTQRLHHARTGEWPEMALEASETRRTIAEYADAQSSAYFPIQSGTMNGQLPEVLLVHLLQQHTQEVFWGHYQYRLSIHGSPPELRVTFPSNLTPTQTLALPETFEPFMRERTVMIRFPEETELAGRGLFGRRMPPWLTEEVLEQYWEQYVGPDAPMPAPLTRERAERMAALHADRDQHSSEFLEFADLVRVTVEGPLDPPEDVRVLWSPGPDGVDGRAAVPYDPTNGTLSAGDIIVFPERFR